MSRDAASGELRELAGVVHAIAGDVERLVGQHAARREPRSATGWAGRPPRWPRSEPARAWSRPEESSGPHGGARPSQVYRIPLWGCYGLVGGALAAAGIGLVAAGTRRSAGIRLVPRETIAVLREDISWLKDQFAGPDGST